MAVSHSLIKGGDAYGYILRAVYIQLADREYYYPLRVVTAQEIAKTA